MKEVGSVREFSNGSFELVEDNIIPNKQKQKFMIRLNLYTILFMFVLLGLSVSIYFLVTDIYVFLLDPMMFILIAISMFLYIVVHELLHGAAFMLFNKTKKNEIKFGLVLKSGVAYCISTVPVRVDASRLSLMMPVYIICLPLFILGFISSNIWLIVLAVFYVSGSTGDFYYMWKLRYTNKDLFMYEEMPTKTGYEIGYLLYRKLD